MLVNWRKVDKFYLSGGWNNLPENIKFLSASRIKAVLDLQFSSFNGGTMYERERLKSIDTIWKLLKDVGIDYYAIDMYDNEHNLNFSGILDEGHKFLAEMEEKYPSKREGILVKCAAGISRSPTMLINHLCITRKMSYSEALNYIRDREEKQGIGFGASPNYFFVEQLKKRFK